MLRNVPQGRLFHVLYIQSCIITKLFLKQARKNSSKTISLILMKISALYYLKFLLKNTTLVHTLTQPQPSSVYLVNKDEIFRMSVFKKKTKKYSTDSNPCKEFVISYNYRFYYFN